MDWALTIFALIILIVGIWFWYKSKTVGPSPEEKEISQLKIKNAEMESMNRIKAREDALAAKIREKENGLISEFKARDEALTEQLNRKERDLIAAWQQKESGLIQSFESKKVEILETEEMLKNRIDNELKLHEEILQSKISAIQTKIKELDISKEEETLRINQEVEIIKNGLEEWKARYDSAILVYKNFEQLKDEANFHKIFFSPEELEELGELNKAIKHLKNPLPFYKAIYEIYYKNKVSDLVNRVVGINRTSGIYKITHIDSGKCYIGQSVDIGERWKQHIKRGVGAETLTNNKLYPAMMELGIENFTFEIVQIVEDTSKLNELEKYWQDFYQAKEFGFSMR